MQQTSTTISNSLEKNSHKLKYKKALLSVILSEIYRLSIENMPTLTFFSMTLLWGTLSTIGFYLGNTIVWMVAGFAATVSFAFCCISPSHFTKPWNEWRKKIKDMAEQKLKEEFAFKYDEATESLEFYKNPLPPELVQPIESKMISRRFENSNNKDDGYR